MTLVAQSAAPPNALTMWTNGKVIFVEIKSREIGRPPYIISYALSEGGLSKALSLLRTHADNAGTPITNRHRSNLSPVKLVGTEAQHDLAQALLRRRGLIK